MLAWWSAFCSIHQQRQGFQLLEGLGLVRFCPISGQIQPDKASSMLAWWSVFCSISEQRQGFRILEGLGLVVRFARFPVNPESGRSGLGGWCVQRRELSGHQRCWLGGRRSARSIRSGGAY
jgi:hypothetical protein